MANQADITAYAGEATPLNHTLTSAGVTRVGDEWLAEWKELSASLPEQALNRLTFRVRLQKNGTKRVSVRVDTPVMESVSGQNSSGYTAPPKVAYPESAEYVQYVHPRSSEAGRRLVRQMLLNVVNGQTASVTPNTAGQSALLIDKLVFPS